MGMEREPKVSCARISNETSCVSRENKNLVLKKQNSKTWTLYNGKVWRIERKDGRHSRSTIATMCPCWAGVLPSLEAELCSPGPSLTLADWLTREKHSALILLWAGSDEGDLWTSRVSKQTYFVAAGEGGSHEKAECMSFHQWPLRSAIVRFSKSLSIPVIWDIF